MKNQSSMVLYLMLWPLAAVLLGEILPFGFAFAGIVAIAAVVLLFMDKVMSSAQKAAILACWAFSVGALVLFFYAFGIGLDLADAGLPQPWWSSGIWALPLLGIAAFGLGGFLVYRFRPAQTIASRRA